MHLDLDKMTPREIVTELDKYIIGQDSAKRAVAVALRNRVRRTKLADDIKDEVAPKNILMIGPTGVGKTEIARRLSRLSGAPFLKVEASKFTEVGYVGRDVESIVRDLLAGAIKMVKAEFSEKYHQEALVKTEERLLDLLLPQSSHQNSTDEETKTLRESFRYQLSQGLLDDRKVEISTQSNPLESLISGSGDIGVAAIPILEDSDKSGSGWGQLFNRSKIKHVTIKQARNIFMQEERDKMIDQDVVNEVARERTEKMGIVFIDEIDKIAGHGKSGHGPDISREGVQRDLLPIVEGAVINTKFGSVDTSQILFIAAGAFHIAKPSDLLPELQGRFPIRVELQEMTAEMFEKILTQPQGALIKQYKELLKTENLHIEFTEDAIKTIAIHAVDLNRHQENTGARRLHSIMETILEDLSFNASEMNGQSVTIDENYVKEKLDKITRQYDLQRYIL